MNTAALAPTRRFAFFGLSSSPIFCIGMQEGLFLLVFVLGIFMHKIKVFKQNSKNSNLEKRRTTLQHCGQAPAFKQETLPSLQYRPR